MFSTPSARALLAIFASIAILIGPAAWEVRAATDEPTWSRTGDMLLQRRDHTATLLADGRVLVLGWIWPTAELYDPATRTFARTGDPAHGHGPQATATRLIDGTVLVVGGQGAPTAEIYDPHTGSFRVTGELNAPRSSHTATLLPSGDVLVVGGGDFSQGARASAEVYSARSGTFRTVGSLILARVGHGAALLPDGRVLVVGGTEITSPGFGRCTQSAEIYDPRTELFTLTGAMNAGRCSLTWSDLPVLSNGKVLVAGGLILDSAELYDPATGTFAFTGRMTTPRAAPTVTLLVDGRVLVAGGASAGGPVTTNTAEIYDPSGGQFTATASMAVARQQHTATRLLDGSVLVTGGFNPTDTEVRSAEIFSMRVPDLTPPTIEAGIAPAANAAGWHRTDVTVTWTVGDPETGIASANGCATTTVTTDSSGMTIACTATNGAGLSRSAAITVRRDTVAPQVEFRGNAGTYQVDQDVNIACVATDDRSGLATPADCGRTAAPAYTFPPGLNVVSGQATDKADNSTTASASFSVRVTYASLCALTERFVDNPGIAGSLCAKLEAAEAADARGNAAARDSALGAYRSELEAQAGKALSRDRAEILARLSTTP
ncbi:MAG TPA: hypothetical protein VGR87_00325 [Candidatus Limnocylindria bacterium]|jgi:hypothetical protein|nr:hypothetical protein [Candidatus Limnocylindria bacterium]